MENIILTHTEIQHKTKRIAYQIYETFIDEEEVVLAGIANSGYIFAEHIAAALNEIADLKVTLCKVEVNKEQPQDEIITSLTSESYKIKDWY